jgi:hypothetical protein
MCRWCICYSASQGKTSRLRVAMLMLLDGLAGHGMRHPHPLATKAHLFGCASPSLLPVRVPAACQS